MQTIRDLDLQGKRVLIRVDFNVPLTPELEISDDIRMRMALPTIHHCLSQNAKIILCSHLGRPKGKVVAKLSLAPVARHLATLLDRPVQNGRATVGAEVEAQVAKMKAGDILLLENLRFQDAETNNDPVFSQQLAALADVYINDAFAVSHRAHASVAGVTEHCTAKGAGFLLEKELTYFQQAMSQPTRPLVAIVGGAKVSSKLGALENMLTQVDRIIIGGAMANTFLKSQGLEVGASLVEDDLLDTAAHLLEQAKASGVKVYLPVDFVVADRFDAAAVTKRVTAQDIPAGWLALDIGPASVLCFTTALEDAQTIVWNGPMGAFEMDPFAAGTMSLARAVGDSAALTITGGGDSNAAVKQAGESERITYMSTGGGAFLKLMEGKILPGVTALS